MQANATSTGMGTAPEADLEPVPGYRPAHFLGAGAFGKVWAAQAQDGSPVALKYLDCRTKPSRAITNEIRALLAVRELQHPHIIQLHSVWAGSRSIVLVMERADRNLNDLHRSCQEKTGKNVPPPLLLELLEQAATALDYLASPRAGRPHSTSTPLQHCDIKPSNLLLVGDCLKVGDFGLCMPESRGAARPSLVGTPPYAAPELYEGRPTSRTDQYALAVTYCELCMGSRPFLETSGTGPARPAMPIDLRWLRENELPVLARALDPRWTNRWPSCQAFIAALRQAVVTPRRQDPAGGRTGRRAGNRP